MAAPAAQIVVSIVDADDANITPKPVTFKPSARTTVDIITKGLERVYGTGLLLDKDGDAVLPGQLVTAGNYTYRVMMAAMAPPAGASKSVIIQYMTTDNKLIHRRFMLASDAEVTALLERLGSDGLVDAAEAENAGAVVLSRTRLNQLQDGGQYTAAPPPLASLPGQTVSMRQHMTHLVARREDELGTAACQALQERFPHESFENRPDLRIFIGEGGRALCETDSVAMGTSMAFVGSHKTFVDSVREVKAIVDVAKEVETRSQDPSFSATTYREFHGKSVRAVFMAEHVPLKDEAKVQQCCEKLGAVRFKRNGASISPVACLRRPARALGTRVRAGRACVHWA